MMTGQRFEARGVRLIDIGDALLRMLLLLALPFAWQELVAIWRVAVPCALVTLLVLAPYFWWRPVALEIDAQALRVVRRWPFGRRELVWSDLCRIELENSALRLVRTDRRVIRVALGSFPDAEAIVMAVRQHFEFDPRRLVAPGQPLVVCMTRERNLRLDAVFYVALFGNVFIDWVEFALLRGVHDPSWPPLSRPPVTALLVLFALLWWPALRAWLKRGVPLLLVALLLGYATIAGNRVLTERSGQDVRAVLQLEDANEERQHWRVLEPPELVRDATLRVSADWPGFDASRQAGERYHVTVRQGWLGDFAIMPEALRAAARSGEVVQ